MKRIVLFGWFVTTLAHGTVDIPAHDQGESSITSHVVRVDTWRVGTREECELLRAKLESAGHAVLGACFTQGQGERDTWTK
jgi:hypothetical protein